MKKLIIKILPFVLIFLSTQLWALQKEFPTKVVNGTEYYIYTVQPAEGLFGISKRFNVTQAQINELNPQIHEGLKAGQEILIPVPAHPKKSEINSKTETPKTNIKTNTVNVKNEPEIVKHLVLKKQTLFAISRIYNINIDEIQQYNPEISNGLKEGMVLNIPINKTAKEETEKLNSQSVNTLKESKKLINKKTKDTLSYALHTVKEKETLYSISKLYNIDVQDIIILNPKSDEKLRIGSKLKIVLKPNSTVAKKETSSIEKRKSIEEEIKYNTRIFESVKPNKEPIKIAFLLPFMLENAKRDPSNDKFAEFYAGALIAINEAKSHGISFEIFTYDTEKSEEKIQEVLKNSELINMDFIIGPAYTNQISYVSNFVNENKINTLIPFSSKVYDVNTNPYLFQFNPGNDEEVKFVTELLNTEFKNENIIFCNIASVNVLDDGNDFSTELQNELNKSNRIFKSVDLFNAQTLIPLIDNDKKNIIVFNTDKYSLVSNYIDSLNWSNKSNKIILYIEYGWQNVNALNIQNFCVAPFKIDYNGTEYKKFNSDFSNHYNWKATSSSPRYDILGYDLTNYFVAQIYNNGKNFSTKKNKLPLSMGIETKLSFERSSDRTGFTNRQLFIIEHDTK